MANARDRKEAVAEVRLGRRARRRSRAPASREEIELVAVGVGRVHDRRARAEAALACEQLDRAQAVLGEALIDLTRLLVGVYVQRQVVLGRVRAELAQRVGRARANGVGGDTDRDPVVAQRLELAQVLGHGLLAEARAAAAQVARVQADERDARLGCGLGAARASSSPR